MDAAHDMADAAGLVLTEGFMWRHTPHARRFVEELPRIGELRTIRSTFSFVDRRPTPTSDWTPSWPAGR